MAGRAWACGSGGDCAALLPCLEGGGWVFKPQLAAAHLAGGGRVALPAVGAGAPGGPEAAAAPGQLCAQQPASDVAANCVAA